MRGFPTTAQHMLPKDPLLTTNVICVGRWERGNSVRLLEGWRRHVLQTPTPINSFVSCTILLFWLMISDTIAFLPLEAHILLLVKTREDALAWFPCHVHFCGWLLSPLHKSPTSQKPFSSKKVTSQKTSTVTIIIIPNSPRSPYHSQCQSEGLRIPCTKCKAPNTTHSHFP